MSLDSKGGFWCRTCRSTRKAAAAFCASSAPRYSPAPLSRRFFSPRRRMRALLSRSRPTCSRKVGRGIIDFNSFSIGKSGTVKINNGAGATLDRVTGGSLSQIMGTLSATGSVYLVNPQGVVVGKSGVITTGGSFVASSLDISRSELHGRPDLALRGQGPKRRDGEEPRFHLIEQVGMSSSSRARW